MDLRSYIKEQRQKAALTQKEAVRLLGYRKSQFLSNLERGTTKPPVEILKKMCEVYRTDCDEMRDQYIQEEVRGARKKAENRWATRDSESDTDPDSSESPETSGP